MKTSTLIFLISNIHIILQVVICQELLPDGWKKGLCQGHHIKAIPNLPNMSLQNCLGHCKSDNVEFCRWVSYDLKYEVCHLHKTCRMAYEGDMFAHYVHANKDVPQFLPIIDFNPNARYIMVAGGDTNLVEVIDTKSEKKCQALPSVPKSKLLDAFGALIDGKPLICGGKDEDFYTTKTSAGQAGSKFKTVRQRDCYTLSIHPPTNENDQWYSKIKWVSTNNTLSYARSMAAASTILNGKYLLATGGIGPNPKSQLTFEIMNMNYEWCGFHPNNFLCMPPSPMTNVDRIYGHCMVTLNETTAMLIGGNTDTTKPPHELNGDVTTRKTWYIITSHDNGLSKPQIEFLPGPELKNSRSEHACGILHQNGTAKFLIVAGGRSKDDNSNDNILNSTEFLDLSEKNHQWKESKSVLPIGLRKSKIVEDPDANSIYLIGGLGNNYDINGETSPEGLGIYRLFHPENDWIEKDYKLEKARAGHIAMFIPENLVSCDT